MANSKGTVFGLHAPPPRPTLTAAFLLACGISLGFLTGLGLWSLAG